MKNTLLMIVLLISIKSFAQQQMILRTFNQTNTPIFTTNLFRAIGAGKDGHIWAGTANSGLYKYNGIDWVKSTTALTNHNIAHIMNDKEGNIWIAQYGSTGAQALGGGINYFSDTTFNNTVYSSSSGLPTRNARSIFIDNSITTNDPKYRVWTAHLGHVTAGVTTTGAVGRGRSLPTPPFKTITMGVRTTNQLGTCEKVGGNSNEVWVYASINTATGLNQILRYNALTDAFIGAYDELNSSLPIGFIARAIYFDKNDLRWIGLQSGGLCVFNNGVFQQINFPGIFPPGTLVNNNAITGDERGNVYIGTSNGLVVYKGGDIQDQSSYTLYTTANGLPSNNINAIVANEFIKGNYSVIMATSAGIVQWQPNLTRVFNTVKNKEFIYDRASENIRVAVDSSTSTIIKAFIPNALQCKLRIKEDSNALSKNLYGEFIFMYRNSDTIAYKLKHPWEQNILSNKFSRLAHLQVYDTILNKVVYEENLDFVRPPLLLVHGLFSNPADAFGNMSRRLIDDSLYKVDQITLANYTSSAGFNVTTQELIPYFSTTLENAILGSKISCGKVDVAGHSMGGLVLRMYLQSNVYKNDINRYVSINSPHMGSPVPNFVLNNPLIKAVVKFILGDPDGGAMNDLKVNSSPVLTKLIGNISNEVKVPAHALVTTFVVPALKFQIPTILLKFEPSKLLTTLVYAHNGISYWNNVLFAGVPHDGVVSENSQRVGLQPAFYTQYSGITHLSTGGPNNDVYNRFKQLMNSSINNTTVFTRNGFTPSIIPVPDNLNRITNNLSGTLAISAPANNSFYSSGTSVTVNFGYTLVDTMVLMIGNPTVGVYAARVDAPTTSYTFNLPNEFIGKVKINVMGYNQNGYSAQDSCYINITTSAILDTLKCMPSKLRVPKTGYSLFDVFGTYTDTVRNITGLTGISYSFLHNKGSFTAPNKINGLAEGLDTIIISYLGKTTRVPLEITDSSEWVILNPIILPVKIIDFSARLINKESILKWNTEIEENVNFYQIEHSINGINFTPIGNVTANSNNGSLNSYSFVHLQPQSGKNYYRLKIMDKDGSFEYSKVLMINVSNTFDVSLYPNPVKNTLSFQLSSEKKRDYNLQILTIEGKLIKTVNLKNISWIIKDLDVSNLSKGVYILNVSSTNTKNTMMFEKL